MTRKTIGIAIAVATVSVTVATFAPTAVARALLARLMFASANRAQPPTTAQCEATMGLACYGPSQLQVAYNMDSLYAQGLTGKGEDILIVDSFGSPTIKSDLAAFDKGFGLPAPPSFKIIQPAGKVPAYNPKDPTMLVWAEETTQDVEDAHTMAPGANIVLAETPVAETVGVQGFPQMIQAENYAIDHGLADVISQSFAAPEQTFPSAGSLRGLRGAYVNAAAHGVSVLAGAGDWGASGPRNGGDTLFFTHGVLSWPASDPLVTAVGGTQLHLNQAGQRLFPDNVWNETDQFGGPLAGGGGVSSIFARPPYQNSVAGTVGNHRGIPDLSLSAAFDGGALAYASFGGLPVGPGYYITGGTSEASPLLSGIVAVADQSAGHRLGLLNPALYKIGSGSPGLPDITTGENTVTFVQGGKTYTVPGFAAVPGYDLASGLGTPDGAKLVAALTGK